MWTCTWVQSMKYLERPFDFLTFDVRCKFSFVSLSTSVRETHRSVSSYLSKTVKQSAGQMRGNVGAMRPGPGFGSILYSTRGKVEGGNLRRRVPLTGSHSSR